MKVRTIGMRQRFGQNTLVRVDQTLNKMAYDIDNENQPHGLVSLSEHVENCYSKISDKINEIIQFISECLPCFIL